MMDNTELDEITQSVTGKHGASEFFGWLSDHAPALIITFVDILAVVAEIRVYDAGMQITGQWYKAIGFVALSAVPFYLGQVVWGYKLSSPPQKIITAALILGGLLVGVLFGRFDLLFGLSAIDPSRVAASVPWITGVYMLMGLAYLLADDALQLRARLAVIEFRAAYEDRKNTSYQRVLATMAETERKRAALRAQYGRRVDALEGNDGRNPAPAYNAETEAVTDDRRPLSKKK